MIHTSRDKLPIVQYFDLSGTPAGGSFSRIGQDFFCHILSKIVIFLNEHIRNCRSTFGKEYFMPQNRIESAESIKFV